jgi:hypothetical protein
VDEHDDHHHEHGHGHGHGHGHDHDHPHDHDHGDADAPDLSDWAASAQTTTCPSCGASGAVMLGGGIFCPACKEVSTNPGFQAPS